MTTKKNHNEAIRSITQSIFDYLDHTQFESIEQKTKMSGEENAQYNKDAVFFLGGILNQIGWSLQSKVNYLADLEKNRVENQVINNTSEQIKPSNIMKAEASIHNATFFYDMMQDIFNIYTGWTWNNGVSTEDYGQSWFARHKEATKGNKVLSDTKSIKAEIKKRMEA